jgi:hypothetical protein
MVIPKRGILRIKLLDRLALQREVRRIGETTGEPIRT